MPTSVLVPIRLCVDPGALAYRRDTIGDAVSRASGRALVRSRDVVIQPRRGSVIAIPAPPIFTWSGSSAHTVPAQTRREVEELLTMAIARGLATTSLVPDRSATGAARNDDPVEPFAAGRYDPVLSRYTVPSYDGNGDDVTVDVIERDPFDWRPALKKGPRVPPPPPVPLETLTPDLFSSDQSRSSLAGAQMWRRVANGDRDAVWLALSALRPDFSGPTRGLISALRQFARDNNTGFRALLTELVESARGQFTGTFTRTANNIRLSVADTDPAILVNRGVLGVLGGVEIAALHIPEAGRLLRKFEKESPGRARIVGLFVALAAVRDELDRYLTDRPPPTVSQLIASLSVPPAIPEEANVAAVVAIREMTKTLGRYAGLVMLTLPDDLRGRQFVYQLERDLLANQRWIVDTLEKIREIDRTILLFQRVYGSDVYGKQEEVRALRESRALYVAKVADNPLPNEEWIDTLRRVADVNYREWFERAANAKLATWQPMVAKLDEVMSKIGKVRGVTHDSYDQRRTTLEGQLRDINTDLTKAKALASAERLGAVNEVEQRIPLAALRVSMLQLWSAAHSTMRDVVDNNRGNSSSARAKMLRDLEKVRGEIAAEYDAPNSWKYTPGPGNQLEMWKMSIEWVQRDIIRAEKEAAFLKIAVALVITVGTLGFGAPEGISIIVFTLGEAVVFAGAMTLVDLALDKPVTLSGFAVDVATNFAVFGFLKYLNVGLLKVALRFPAGQTLSRLAVIFGGNYVGTTVSGALISRFESGRWPENIGAFLAMNALLNAIGGALVGRKMLQAFEGVDTLRGEVMAMARALAEEHRAWLAEMNAIAARGDVTEAEFAAFKARGEKIFSSIEQLTTALQKVEPAVLASMGLSKAVLQDIADRAGDLAAQIRAASFEARPSVKQLPAPNEIVLDLVKTSGSTFEYNPNAPATRPGRISAKMKEAGYLLEESGGVIKLLEAGSTQPRFLLVPGRSETVAPALEALLLPGERLSRRGLRVLRQQSAVPPLESRLVSIATTNPNAAKAILVGIGRRIDVDDVQLLQAVHGFLENGGSPKALGVLLGVGDRFGNLSAREMLLRLPTLQQRDYAAIDAIVELMGAGGRATDVLIGISRYGTNGAERSGVYGAIQEIIPHTNSGLRTVLGALASWDQNQNQGALGVIRAARRMLADHPGARLDFEVEHVNAAGKVIRVTDIKVTLPGDDPLGYLMGEAKEFVSVAALINPKARSQFRVDVELSLRNPPPGDRLLARIRWLVRMPDNASPELLTTLRRSLKQSMGRVFAQSPVLRNDPALRTRVEAEFEKHFDDMLIFH